MKPFIDSSSARQAWSLFLLTLLAGPAARAAKVSTVASDPSQAVALARYIESHGERDAFANSSPIAVIIQGALPKLYKEAALSAVRSQGENGGRVLHVVQVTGDDTVTSEVLDRYLALRQQVELLPPSSVRITPANYNFHFAGEVKNGGSVAYSYDITPRKKKPGLLSGQIWIDSGTGNEVMLSGQMPDLATSTGRIGFVRDTKVVNGIVCGRITHVTFDVPLLGRAEVTITEVDLTPTILSERQ